MKIKHLTQLV